MILDIDTDKRSVVVVEGADCKRLSARISGGGTIAAALGSFGRPDVDGAHLWIDIGQLRIAAGANQDSGWTAQFDGMIRYAASKGWLNEHGDCVRVHLASA